MALLFEEKIVVNKDEFIRKVIDISNQLGMLPDWLMAVMNSETGGTFSPTIQNKISKAIGLIQFMPTTAAFLFFGKDKAKNKGYQLLAMRQLANMSNVQQLDYVFKYFAPYRGLYNSFEDLYVVTFYPNAGGKHGGTLSKPDDWTFPNKVTEDNPGIDLDPVSKKITIKSFREWASKKIPAEQRQSILGKENVIVQDNINKAVPQQAPVAKGEVIYVHTYSSIKTLDELIAYKRWQNQETGAAVSANDILNYSDNKQSIRSAYSKREGKQINDGDEKNNLPVGVKLKIPAKYIRPEFVVFDGGQIIVPNDDTETFISDALQKVTTSPEYRFTLKSGGQLGKIRKSIPRPRVWIWCKSLGTQDEPGKPRFSSEGQIFDLTPFIINLQTNVTKTGGNFSFSLPPITCECELHGWTMRTENVRTFTSNNGTKSFVSKDYIHKVIPESNYIKRNNWFFHNLINENDIVFISFDTPESEPIEGLRTLKQQQQFSNPKVPKDLIPGNFYDMIGLIDRNGLSYSSTGNQVMINISGRDNMKLVLEDSSYFLNVGEQGKQTQGIFANDNPENWGRPIRNSQLNITSPILALSISQERTVGEMIQFIFSALASIEICPDSLFSAYDTQENGFGISRYSFFDETDNTVKLYRGAGIWQIIKVQIDPENVNDRYVVDASLAVHSGSLFNGIRIFIDDRFIEIMGDTYLDQYFFVIRRPPYNRKSVLDYLDKLTTAAGLNLDDSEVISETLEWYTGDVYSWYRLNNVGMTFGKPILNILDFLPVIYFREYCEIWGNKALDVQTNYMPFEKTGPGQEYQGGGDNFETQNYEDLAYLVETNAYLPFTRSGTISIKQDRRIKRGVWIRYKPTSEVFYVESVSHSYTVNGNSTDAITTLQVSRGMVEYNDAGQYILPYYFRIIDGLPNSDKERKPDVEETTISEPIRLNVYFDFDKDTLIQLDREDLSSQDLEKESTVRRGLKETGDKSLEDLLQDLINDKTLRIKIIGHTDERGSEAYNQDLGQRRADNIRKELIRRWNSRFPDKIDESRITTESRGEVDKIDFRNPDDPVIGKEVLANNRRIEVQYIRTSSKATSQPAANAPSLQNDYSKWKVNQEIFNFFLARKQFCSRIENFENLGDYNIPNKPEPLIIVEESLPNNKKANDMQRDENMQQYMDVINQNPFMVARYDDLTLEA